MPAAGVRERTGRRTGLGLRVAPALWPLGLSVLLVWPLLVEGGYPLARDLVFLPRHALNADALGLGGGSPRAVPLDAVVALLTTVVDGGVLARVALPLVPALAGWGVQRLLAEAGTPARLAAGGLAVWNPYVVERLALGQWALLAGYAALPWIVLAAARFRHGGAARDLGAATLWTALASLTPTGGLLAVAGLAGGGLARSRRSLWLLGAGAALQAPWLVAAVAGPAARTSDPAAVAVFAPDTEGPYGAVVAVLGLGGIWDAAAEPRTRETWLALLAAAVTVLVLVMGGRVLARMLGTDAVRRWGTLAGVLGAVVLLTATPWGQDLVRWAVTSVPGAGLLRDGGKFLAPVVLLVALSTGALAERLIRAGASWSPEVRVSVLMPVVVLPLLLLPDATTVTWPTVSPVRYPGGYGVVATVVEDRPGAVVTLPWRGYRSFSWAGEQTASDPAPRWFDTEVVVSDDLQVGSTLVRGESPRAAAVADTLAAGPPAAELGAVGVGWVLVHPDDPEAGSLDLTGLEPVRLGERLRLYRVPGPLAEVAPAGAVRRFAVGLGWAVGLLTLVAGVLLRLRPAPGGSPNGHRPHGSGS